MSTIYKMNSIEDWTLELLVYTLELFVLKAYLFKVYSYQRNYTYLVCYIFVICFMLWKTVISVYVSDEWNKHIWNCIPILYLSGWSFDNKFVFAFIEQIKMKFKNSCFSKARIVVFKNNSYICLNLPNVTLNFSC